MRKITILLASVFAFCFSTVHAITRSQLIEYSSSLKGLKKAELKTAANRLMDKKTTLSYGSGEYKTWWGFYVTDRDPNTNACVNRYSDQKFSFGSRGNSISGMNIEHSFPKSWWGGSKNDAYQDLFNLYPCETKANSAKSNYVMGVVTQVNSTHGEGYGKVGKGYAGGSSLVNIWEPGDQYKGDFTRSYFYMATTYQDFSWESEGAKQLTTGDYPTLQKWAYELFLEWHRQDMVTPLEIDRNNAVYGIQGNRNLFVDFPNLAEYIWGDSIDVAFDPDMSVTTASDDSRYTGEIKPDTPVTPPTPDDPDQPEYEFQGDGTEANPYTVADAIHIASALNSGENTDTVLHVRGYVTNVKEIEVEKYGNATFSIADERGGNVTFLIYRCYDLGNQWFTDKNAIKVGDEVVVKGLFTNYKGNTPETVTGKAHLVSINGVTTGIEAIEPITRSHKIVYTLSGQRMKANCLKPGVYVVEGKKIVVK